MIAGSWRARARAKTGETLMLYDSEISQEEWKRMMNTHIH